MQRMRQMSSLCFCFVLVCSVAGALSNSSEKNASDESEEERSTTTTNKNVRAILMQLICQTLNKPKSSEDDDDSQQELSLDLGLTSFKAIPCRTRPRSRNDDDDDEDDEGNSQFPRQVDPMHSCIEAKCSGGHSGNSYLDCIFRNCITVYQLGVRRFLAVKRAVQSAKMRSLAAKRGVASVQRGVASEQRVVASAQRGVASAQRGVVSTPEVLDADDGEFQTSDHVTEAVGAEKREDGVKTSRLQQQLVMMTMMKAMTRRGFNDITDVCVKHNCGSLHPHSMNFFSCVESHCAFR